mmetsp:Transcript_7372/g.16716  ORF Transcript_7372/g.16716 Transcript_7372/m.16716 type:complete len:216 (+) Transcript_7372:771-1418(+)
MPSFPPGWSLYTDTPENTASGFHGRTLAVTLSVHLVMTFAISMLPFVSVMAPPVTECKLMPASSNNIFPIKVRPANMSTFFRYESTPERDVSGSSNDTSGAYHESTIGLKNEIYSLASTCFILVMVLASSSDCVVVEEASVLVVDMKIPPPLRRLCTVDIDRVAGWDGRELLNASPLWRNARARVNLDIFMIVGWYLCYFVQNSVIYDMYVLCSM